MSNEITIEDLAPNHTDFLTGYAKGGLGAIPYFGALFGEVIGQIIPHQRVDRIVAFLGILDKKFEQLKIEFAVIESKLKNEEYINLFEEGIWQAARTSSQERKEHIASLLANSLSDEALNEIQQGVLLSLLGELNDIEILILYQHTMKARNNKEFQEKYQDILRGPFAHLGADEETINQSTIHNTYKEKLIRLNLLKREYKALKKGELPEFDNKTGMIKEKSVGLTSLGRLLLRYIDMPDEF
jgi:hypothetical protein